MKGGWKSILRFLNDFDFLGSGVLPSKPKKEEIQKVQDEAPVPVSFFHSLWNCAFFIVHQNRSPIPEPAAQKSGYPDRAPGGSGLEFW